MAPRAYWKGSLKLSLVTCPIALYPASTQAEKTHFHQINTKTGHRLKQQMVDEQTGRVVDKDGADRCLAFLWCRCRIGQHLYCAVDRHVHRNCGKPHFLREHNKPGAREGRARVVALAQRGNALAAI